MDLRYSEAEEQFRQELRHWLGEMLPTLPPKPAVDDWAGRRAYDTGWQRTLFDGGYAGINWPKEYGGRGATLTEQLIYLEETTLAGAPYVGVNFVGMMHAGPTLIAEASDEQKAAHLPALLKGDEVWCQGFSEPNAGSDLASLSCKAYRDGDEYVITGQKTWTSFAHVADWCELLVRTDPDAPKHKGITWLMFPMDTPGIEIRGITTVMGSSEFSEVFFDEARVSVSNRVGAENDGWRVTSVTLGFERGTGFISDLVETNRMISDLVLLAKQVTRRSATAWDDMALRREIGRLQSEMDALWAMTKRNLSQAERTDVPGLSGSLVKIFYSELFQRMTDLALRILDRAGLSRTDVGDLPSGIFVEERLRSLAFTIAAGSSQIQRNIVAERMLGLPRGATVDFELNDDQVALQDGVRSFCEGRFSSADVRELIPVGGFSADRWRELGELGLFSLRLPEADGGTGLGWADAVLAYEELGRALVPGPLVWTHLAAGLVPGAAEGLCAVTGLERADASGIVEFPDAVEWIIVLDADGAQVVDRADVEIEPLPVPLDPLTPVGRLVGALPEGEQVLDAAGATALRFEGATLTSALLLGVADGASTLAVAYAKERRQFNRPIGSFQALKHMMADMLVRTEVARAAVYAAGVTLDDPVVGSLDRAVSAAKVTAGEAAVGNAKTGVQVHGGMGFTWEVDAHLYLKRAYVLDPAFGNVDDWSDHMAFYLGRTLV